MLLSQLKSLSLSSSLLMSGLEYNSDSCSALFLPPSYSIIYLTNRECLSVPGTVQTLALHCIVGGGFPAILCAPLGRDHFFIIHHSSPCLAQCLANSKLSG